MISESVTLLCFLKLQHFKTKKNVFATFFKVSNSGISNASFANSLLFNCGTD